MTTDEKKAEPINHFLVPKHEKLTKEEAEMVFSTFKMNFDQLPKILVTDAAIEFLSPKVGEVIKVTRKSATAGESVFYRGVVNE
jgi:DNA-directed RNA polymerase subunit H